MGNQYLKELLDSFSWNVNNYPMMFLLYWSFLKRNTTIWYHASSKVQKELENILLFLEVVLQTTTFSETEKNIKQKSDLFYK